MPGQNIIKPEVKTSRKDLEFEKLLRRATRSSQTRRPSDQRKVVRVGKPRTKA